MEEEEIRNIKLRTQIKTAKQVLKKVYEKSEDFEDDDFQIQISTKKFVKMLKEIEEEFLQEKDNV